MNDLDKDIEKVKELVKNLKEKFKRISGAIAIMPRIEEEDVQAIENVVSELERKDNIIDLMSRAILNYDDQLVINKYRNKEEVKKYFEENYEELMKIYDR